MANKEKKAEQWKEAKLKCRLNVEDIRIAKEMGLNPLSLIKNIPTKDQLWKTPVKVWLHEIYQERQNKSKKAADKPAAPEPVKKLTLGIKS